MKSIIITGETDLPHEIEVIRNLISERVIVHIRKKNRTREEMMQYLDQFSGIEGEFITLHGHHDLAKEYNLGGIHLSSKETVADKWSGRQSKSCHSFEDIDQIGSGLNYVFLSPIYDSISKIGYRSSFTTQELIDGLKKVKHVDVFALGGVTSEKIEELEQMGFCGSAICGDFWNSESFSWNEYLLKTLSHG